MYGAPYGGARLDVNGDGIPDVRVGPYGQMRPDVGTFVHGPTMYPPYGGMGYGVSCGFLPLKGTVKQKKKNRLPREIFPLQPVFHIK